MPNVPMEPLIGFAHRGKVSIDKRKKVERPLRKLSFNPKPVGKDFSARKAVYGM